MPDHTNDIRQIRQDIAALKARRPGQLEKRQSANVNVKIPEGEYQFMVLQMVSDNQVGYDFVRAHPIVSG